MSSCRPGIKVSELKFENVRDNNLEKINNYYESVNSQFNTHFTNIKNDLSSPNSNASAIAEQELNKTDSEILQLNNHLKEINFNMNKLVKTDFKTIEKLLKEIKEQDKVLKSNEEEIDNLYKLLKVEEVEFMKNEDSVENTEKFNVKVKQYHDILIFINVLVFLVIVVGVYSLIYPKEFIKQAYGNNENLNNNNNNNNKYNSNKNNTSLSNDLKNINNIYKNKKMNNNKNKNNSNNSNKNSNKNNNKNSNKSN